MSKLDTCDFSPERFLAIKEALGPYLRTCGFKDSAVQWLPAVGPSGEKPRQAATGEECRRPPPPPSPLPPPCSLGTEPPCCSFPLPEGGGGGIERESGGGGDRETQVFSDVELSRYCPKATPSSAFDPFPWANCLSIQPPCALSSLLRSFSLDTFRGHLLPPPSCSCSTCQWPTPPLSMPFSGGFRLCFAL